MSPRGGYRKGAGRKKERKTPLVAVTLRIEPELLKAFNREKKSRRMSGPKLLADLLIWP